MATHSSILVWRIHGQRSLVGYSAWGRKKSDMTERLSAARPAGLSHWRTLTSSGPLVHNGGSHF